MPLAAPPGSAALASALRKARLRVIPLLSICYLVAYMDRSNISFAAETMNRDLHFSPSVYGLGAGLFFLTYAACEIPANRLLFRFGARRWLGSILCTWGLLAAAMMLVRGPVSFYTSRMLLGVAESGYFPGAIFVLSLWFPAWERARSISWFYISLPLSSVVMGGAAGLLLGLDGRLGLRGWQWLFLVEALPAVLLGVLVWLVLPDQPATASWLAEDERAALIDELEADPVRRRAAASDGQHSGMRQALRSPAIWLMGGFMFCTLGPLYAVTFSLPLLLRQLTGWSPGQVGFLIAGFGVSGAAAMLANAAHSDRTGERYGHVLLPTVLMGAGFLLAGLHLAGWLAVLGLLLVTSAYYSMQGPYLGLFSMILTGEAAAVAISIITMCGITGGFVFPYLLGWLRELTGSYAVPLSLLALPCLAAAVLMQPLVRSMRIPINLKQATRETRA